MSTIISKSNDDHSSTNITQNDDKSQKVMKLIPQKQSKGSLPSKYETIIYKRTVNNAFGSSVERMMDLRNHTQTYC